MDVLSPALDLSAVTLAAVPATHPVFTARRVNWRDQADVHRAVMALFADNLPGPERSKRSTSAILYRLEAPSSGARALIQSHTPPQRTDHGIATTTLSGLKPVLTRGALIQFRVDVNAVRAQSRTGRRLPVTDDAVQEFLLNPSDPDRPGLLAGAAENLTILDVASDVRAANGTPLRVARVNGECIVADPLELTDRIVHGIGRGKSYGCGLLTIAPRS